MKGKLYSTHLPWKLMSHMCRISHSDISQNTQVMVRRADNEYSRECPPDVETHHVQPEQSRDERVVQHQTCRRALKLLQLGGIRTQRSHLAQRIRSYGYRCVRCVVLNVFGERSTGAGLRGASGLYDHNGPIGLFTKYFGDSYAAGRADGSGRRI